MTFMYVYVMQLFIYVLSFVYNCIVFYWLILGKIQFSEYMTKAKKGSKGKGIHVLNKNAKICFVVQIKR